MQEGLHPPGVRWADLRGHEHLGAVQAAISQRLSDLSLVGIHRRSVDVPVADFKSREHRRAGLTVAQLPGAKPDQRHARATRQPDRRNLTRCAHSVIIARARPYVWQSMAQWAQG